jgi:vancomycin resistance protein VanW
MTECRRHAPDAPGAAPSIAWLVDAPTAELAALCRAEAGAEDLLMLPTRRFGAGARAWPKLAQERTADLAALRRSLALRTAPARAPRAALLMAADARLAAAFARRLPPSRTRLRVAQSLLPHLWLAGVLQGRRFEVLVDRLPMDALQRALDEALARHPDSLTLGDFRASPDLVAAERAALAAADRLVTAHRAAAALLPGRVDLIDWAPALPLPARRGGRTFLLAGPALARKGIHALREAMAGLDMSLLVERSAEEEPGFWSGLDVRILAPGEQPAELAGVVLPALVEHRPKMLLRALAAGLPAIATEACGLPPQPGLTLVAPDDAEGLRAALIAALPSPSVIASNPVRPLTRTGLLRRVAPRNDDLG